MPDLVQVRSPTQAWMSLDLFVWHEQLPPLGKPRPGRDLDHPQQMPVAHRRPQLPRRLRRPLPAPLVGRTHQQLLPTALVPQLDQLERQPLDRSRQLRQVRQPRIVQPPLLARRLPPPHRAPPAPPPPAPMPRPLPAGPTAPASAPAVPPVVVPRAAAPAAAPSP